MRHSRNILAVAVLALALCADRTVAAGSASQRPHGQTFTAQIVRKLQQSFRRIVPSVDPFRQRVGRAVNVIAAPFVSIESAAIARPLSPFQFRLPPPGC